MSDHSRSTDASREALSALVDGQAHHDEVSQILNVWKTDAVARAAWRDYHFVGDVMRSAELAQGTDGDRFLQKLRVNLASEAVVLAPAAARSVTPEARPSSAPVVALRRRSWLGPTAVAAGFVMVVGAMVSALAPISSVPAEALASADPFIHLASPEADSNLAVSAVMPMATALDSSHALMAVQTGLQSGTDAGNSFSRPARASAVLIRDPRLDQVLGIRRAGMSHEASFASQHVLSQSVAFETP